MLPLFLERLRLISRHVTHMPGCRSEEGATGMMLSPSITHTAAGNIISAGYGRAQKWSAAAASGSIRSDQSIRSLLGPGPGPGDMAARLEFLLFTSAVAGDAL